MLEHELRRLRTENAVLLESLQRAEKLVYGQSFLGAGGSDENRQPNGGVGPRWDTNPNPYAGHHQATSRLGAALADRKNAGGRTAAPGTKRSLVRRVAQVNSRNSSGAGVAAATKVRGVKALGPSVGGTGGKELPAPMWGANLPSR